jgi:hypothetical protein
MRSDTQAVSERDEPVTLAPQRQVSPAGDHHDRASIDGRQQDPIAAYLRLEHDSRGDSAGLEVGDCLVYLVERSRFADHACLAGVVQLEHLT